MTKDLEGRVALVTGGSRGIGRAVSLMLAGRGANVVIAYLRNRRAAEETAAEIEGEGVKCVPLRANVGDVGHIETMFDRIAETFGRLDVFVSNAATGVIRPIADLDERAWEWTMNANARALLLCARRARTLMTDGGWMVGMSSGGANRVLPGYAVVGASKASIEALVRYLAVEFAPQVNVNCVSPGVVDTDALKHFPMRDEMLAEGRAKTPAGRLTTPADVADAVRFLTSDAARMVTGHTLVVDGGASLLA
ncbi:MAG TPA: enoyl-[acyl-carrier-protein] reductase FabL [Actinomycetota bacterium]|nr:enoyl-[acyl-carrier-protein] reductase FabL [Actinomycetota bacterium]